MPRLIHLNGPPRVGKSTLARRYARTHSDTLALDLDELAGSVDGVQEGFFAALEVARVRARELALRHLRKGHDVVLPQLVTSHDRVPDPALEETARAAAATYVQVVLTADDAEHLRRLHGKHTTTGADTRIQAALVAPGSDLVDRIRRHLDDYLVRHPPAVVLDTTDLTEDEAYHRLADALHQGCG